MLALGGVVYDITLFDEFLDAVEPDAMQSCSLRQGKIVAVSAPTVSVQIAGSSVTVNGVHYLASYAPAVNDTVWLARQGTMIFVIGKLGSQLGTSVLARVV